MFRNNPWLVLENYSRYSSPDVVGCTQWLHTVALAHPTLFACWTLSEVWKDIMEAQKGQNLREVSRRLFANVKEHVSIWTRNQRCKMSGCVGCSCHTVWATAFIYWHEASWPVGRITVCCFTSGTRSKRARWTRLGKRDPSCGPPSIFLSLACSE